MGDLCHSWGKSNDIPGFQPSFGHHGGFTTICCRSAAPHPPCIFICLYKCVSGTGRCGGGHIPPTHPFTCCVFLSLFCLPCSVSSLFSAAQPVTLTQAAITQRQRFCLQQSSLFPSCQCCSSTIFFCVCVRKGGLLSTTYPRKIYKRG